MNKKLSIFLLFFVVIIDQVSKFFANYLGVEITLNKGVSLNFLSSMPANLITVTTIALTLFIFILLKKDWIKNPAISGLFFGGAASNILDRLFFGGVRDWLPIPFFDVQNNLADWTIFLGLVFMVFSIKGDKA